jgi:hypothetical protein
METSHVLTATAEVARERLVHHGIFVDEPN